MCPHKHLDTDLHNRQSLEAARMSVRRRCMNEGTSVQRRVQGGKGTSHQATGHTGDLKACGRNPFKKAAFRTIPHTWRLEKANLWQQ